MEETDKFKAAISPFLATWNTIEIKAIADLERNILVSMVSCLSPGEPRPSEITDPIQGISFVRQVLPISELNRMLDEWKQGIINLCEHPLSVSQFSNIRYVELSNLWDDLIVGWPEFQHYRQFFLGAEGPSDLTQLLRPKDVHAIARVLGFSSFAELSSDRVQFKVGDSRLTRIYIFAPLLATVESDVRESDLQLRVTVHRALQVNDIFLSYRVQDHRGYRVAGGQIASNQFHENASEYFTVLTGSAPIPNGGTSGEVHLFYKIYSAHEPVASTRFIVPPPAGEKNPRWDTALSLIANTQKWNRMGVEVEDIIKQWLGLARPEPKSEEFERAIAILLFAANLPFLPIGEADGVDQVVLVSEPSQVAITIACSVSPDVGKGISNLLKQKNRVADRLPGFSVHAVIVAPVEERDLRLGDIEDCKAADINLILKTDIQTLFDQVRGVGWGESKARFIDILTRPHWAT